MSSSATLSVQSKLRGVLNGDRYIGLTRLFGKADKLFYVFIWDQDGFNSLNAVYMSTK